MLIRFQVSNHRSIDEPIELSMVAVDDDRPAARGFDLINEKLLTVAGIYGPNASGKSNVLNALDWLSQAVASSLRAWDGFIPREPFRFNGGPARSTSFEADMMVDGVRYSYVLELDDEKVHYEALYSFPERRPRRLFEREGMELAIRRGLGSLSGVRELLTPTTLALSASTRFDSEIREFGRRLGSMSLPATRRQHRMLPLTARSPGAARSTRRLILESAEDAASVLALLRYADLGIDDFDVVEVLDERSPDQPFRAIRLVHRVAEEKLAFEMADESEGTRTWYQLIGPVLTALRDGQILLFDEIDASLHPRLSAKLLELFQDPDTNPLGAQLIFTSHDTSLLNSLNRDEVWLTEKQEDASTTLVALAEFGGDKVRRSLNLERAYLQGRFGAVPELDQVLLRHALGLSTEAGR
ncbi:ATP/GTP-binding protein [Catenuloplanes sp. NPDC051500]|uniref:ATP/GTP-binding protein n=1 Tax=Catenuloplanes sp. NPDC051500 TaxID=3363959 RepID=UPI0037B54386